MGEMQAPGGRKQRRAQVAPRPMALTAGARGT
jgi:hypothetical protein